MFILFLKLKTLPFCAGHCGLRALEQTLNASALFDEEGKSNDAGNTSVKPLTKATCTKQLLDWINTSASHDGPTLFSLIQERRIPSMFY